MTDRIENQQDSAPVDVEPVLWIEKDEYGDFKEYVWYHKESAEAKGVKVYPLYLRPAFDVNRELLGALKKVMEGFAAGTLVRISPDNTWAAVVEQAFTAISNAEKAMGRSAVIQQTDIERPSDYCCLNFGCQNKDACNNIIGKPCGWPGTREQWEEMSQPKPTAQTGGG